MQEVIDRVQQRVTPSMNEALLADYTEEEIVNALNGIGDLKAQGLMVCLLFSSRNSGKQLEES
jgi:hypothetical protein